MDLLLTNHYGQCSMRARKQALKFNSKHPAANRSYCAEPFGWTWALREPTRLQYTPIQPDPAHFRLEDELELETNSSKMTQRGHQIDVHAFFVGHMDRDGREVQLAAQQPCAIHTLTPLYSHRMLTSRQPLSKC